MSVEIACDESGFTGGNLTFRHTVFTHASLRVPVEIAREEMARLRSKVAAHGELKASWLLRWCDDDDLHRLLDPGGLLGDQVRVHLTDTRLFLLCRLADVLLGTDEVSGLDLPGEAGDVREVALELYRQGDTVFGLHALAGLPDRGRQGAASHQPVGAGHRRLRLRGRAQ